MGKKALERLKLELEIKNLKKAWYKDAEIWKTIIPTIAIIASLYFTFGQGILDSQKSKLELEKSQLQLDISRFETKRNQLVSSIEDKDSIRIALEKQIFIYNAQKNDLVSKINGLKTQLGIKDKLVENVTNEKLKDKKFYQNKLLNQLKIEKDHQKEIDKLEGIISDHLVTLAGVKAENEFLKKRTKLTAYEQSDMNIAKSSAQIEELNRNSKKLEESMKRNREKFEAEKKRIEKLSTSDLYREFELLLLDYEK